MNILIVTQYFYPENFKINDLALELRTRGHRVSVLTGIPNYPAGKWFKGYGLKSTGHQQWQGIDIYRVPLLPRFSGGGVQLALNYLSFAAMATVMSPMLCRGKMDAIFVYEPSPFTVGLPAVFLRWLKQAPLWFWVQDLWPESVSAAGQVSSGYILGLLGKMVRFIYRRCDVVLVQSRGFIEPAIKAGAQAEKIHYFPNWAESFYRPVDTHGKSELPKGFNIVFAGNMGAAQSLDTIVQAASELKNIDGLNWVMIGDGRRKQWMQDEVDRLGISDKVFFLGRRPAEDMPRYFSQADVMLATLTREYIFSLTIPAKVQSYLACGRPVLAALDGVGNDIVNESGCGYAVPASDGKALADAAQKIFQLPVEQRDAMGKAGLAYYEKNFDKNQLIDDLEKQFVQVSEVAA